MLLSCTRATTTTSDGGAVLIRLGACRGRRFIGPAVGGRCERTGTDLAGTGEHQERLGADIVEAACRRIPVDREAIGPDGTVIGLTFAVEIAEVWDALLSHLGKL